MGGATSDMPFRFVLLNRLNLCELFFEKSVREGGVIIFVKKWVLIGFSGLNRCFSSINRPLLTQTDPKRTIRPHQTSENLLACWLVGVGAKKKGPYSHEPGTFEFYE